MRWRFKSVLSIIFLLIIICVATGVGYLFYDKVLNDADIDVDGVLTINYINGKKFSFNSDATLTMSVTNNSDDISYYSLEFKDVYADDVTYTLTSSDDYKIDNPLKNGVISDQIAIDPNKTISFNIDFKTSKKGNYRGTISVGYVKKEEDNFSAILLKNNQVNNAPLSKLGDASSIDEGLLRLQDNTGISYVFRGKTTNNNLSFAGLNWKILKINGNGTIKIVLDRLISNTNKYNEKDIDFLETTIYKELDAWYKDNLLNKDKYISYYNFCNDKVLDSDGENYAAKSRLITNKIPSLVCLGSEVNSKIGLLTADEVVLAGASLDDNLSYYLYNNDIKNEYFTMTYASKSGEAIKAFTVSANGALKSDTSINLIRGIRPVINLSKDVLVTGTGKDNDPYIIVES